MNKYELFNGTALAYIGDSYYDLMVKRYLIDKGYTKVNDLHKLAEKYVSADSQAYAVTELSARGLLTGTESEIVKRGRNAKINHAKNNVSLYVYKQSTSYEALIGYLYLLNYFERLADIIDATVKIIESR